MGSSTYAVNLHTETVVFKKITLILADNVVNYNPVISRYYSDPVVMCIESTVTSWWHLYYSPIINQCRQDTVVNVSAEEKVVLDASNIHEVFIYSVCKTKKK